MAQADPGAALQTPNQGRLNGWKEIAGYLGKSVRTASRWEHQLRLPIHRIHTHGGEIVFAFRAEIDRWQAAVEDVARSPETDQSPVGSVGSHQSAVSSQQSPVEQKEEGGRQAAGGRRQEAEGTAQKAETAKRLRAFRRVAIFATGALVLAVGIVLAWKAGWRKAEPASWRVEDNTLKVYDAAGNHLWEHSFGFALSEGIYRGNNAWPKESIATIEDLDGDGRREILFLAVSESEKSGLYCFASDGTLRFSITSSNNLATPVQFGSTQYSPPFLCDRFLTTPEANGTRSVWLVSRHNLSFPAVVQKLTPRGEVAAEYWSNGHINAMKESRISGRRYLLVGGTNNEYYGASLAVLDYEHPSGSAPAVNPYYRCESCPRAQPVAFLVFPRMELSREVGSRPNVNEIRVEPNGRAGRRDPRHAGADAGAPYLTVSVLQPDEGIPGEPLALIGPVFYTLNSEFQVLEAEIGDAYRHAHSKLELMGRLKHRYGERDERELFPVLSWDGAKFAKINGPVTQASQ